MERGPYRRLILGGLGIGLMLFIATLLWPLLTSNPLGNPKSGANPAAPDTTASRGVPGQQAGQSAEVKNNPAGSEDPSGGRAREIKQTAEPLSLSDDQAKIIRDTLKSADNPPKLDKADFEMMVGTAVPKQIPTKDLPPKISEVLNGFAGSQYTVVQDKLVIIDRQSGRVAAIVPNVN
jgi:hypothetical protein